MADDAQKQAETESTRRRFLERLGQGAVAVSIIHKYLETV